ncbi:MAG: hypothetical protein U0Y68_19750 [Blastocatellia bacterium]
MPVARAQQSHGPHATDLLRLLPSKTESTFNACPACSASFSPSGNFTGRAHDQLLQITEARNVHIGQTDAKDILRPLLVSGDLNGRMARDLTLEMGAWRDCRVRHQ